MSETKLSGIEAAVEKSQSLAAVYTTTTEIAFIKALFFAGKAKPLDRVRAYRSALEKRDNWTGINRAEVFAYIDRLLVNAGRSK